ncbi:MAG: enoyl-CoA hydratase/isomerase family protein [Acidimicrobiia bacterium]
MSDDLRVEHGGEHAILTLDRPAKKNALSTALRDEMSDALETLAADASVKALVITGAGDTFSAGFDLSEFPRSLEDEAYARALWASSDRYHHAVLRFPVPTIAAVNGAALAGGFDLAVCCDLRVASTTARFAHPEYTLGDVVYAPLADLVGGAIARELCLTGRTVDAREALALRLVNAVVEPDALMGAARAMVERIMCAPRENLVRTKAKAVDRLGFGVERLTLDL